MATSWYVIERTLKRDYQEASGDAMPQARVRGVIEQDACASLALSILWAMKLESHPQNKSWETRTACARYGAEFQLAPKVVQIS